jgi:plasmid stabilization system protein ParE
MDESIEWYDFERAGLGIEFASEIESFLTRIADTPEQFSKVRGDVRRASVLRRFPYTIHFLPEADRIVVLAVFHVKRSPRTLEDR